VGTIRKLVAASMGCTRGPTWTARLTSGHRRDVPAVADHECAGRVRLRQDSDLAAIAAGNDDPEARRWLDDEPAAAKPGPVSVIQEIWRGGTAAPLVIADAVTDNAVGLINLQFRDDHVATLAYRVFPASRGQGFASRAVRLVTSWAFRDIGLTSLLLEIDEANDASLKVAEKCQFGPVDTRTELASNGARHTTLVFARQRP